MSTKLLVSSALALVVLAPAIADAQCPAPGFQYAAFGQDSVSVAGGATTDSFDSSVGTYAVTAIPTGGDMGTNSVAAGAFSIAGSSTTINGKVDVGFGGTPASVVSISGLPTTGPRAARSSALALPPVAVPVVGTPQGNRFQAGGTLALAPNQTYGNVQVTANGTLLLSPGVYVLDNLTLTGNSTLSLPTGPVEIYFNNTVNLSGGSVSNGTGRSTNLVFFGAPTATTVDFRGGATAAFAVYAPATDITVTGNADFFGSLVGRTITATGGANLHYDRALGAYSGGPFVCPSIEVSRATPILATISGQNSVVQGTYETPFPVQRSINAVADIATFEFPWVKGHMRARAASSISTTASAFSSGAILFDAGAAGKIPPVNPAGCGTFDGSCRNVFTNTAAPSPSGTAFHPPRVQLNDGNSAVIGALIAPLATVPGITPTDWQAIVRLVLAGQSGGTVSALGGVDRSTVAVIPASNLASGAATRPTMAYFGASDGMLHAVCASTGGTTPSQTNVCPTLGTELWAFLPRVQLPLVRTNTTRLDGSVHVIDAFGDFNNPPTGKKSFRTILVFQTGFSDSSMTTPAAYALDITDPANPQIVWEYVGATPRGPFELGVGLSTIAGAVLVGGKAENLAVLQTNNSGTSGAGMVATALALETGTVRWQFGAAYPSPPRGVAADLPLPVNGVPGGAVGVDLVGQGFITDFVMGDLYGSFWKLASDTGASRTGVGVPLFQFSGNKRPIGAVPAIYSNGSTQIAAFASGGYVDPVAATWSGPSQSLIGVKLTSTGPFPLQETSPSLAISEPLAAGDRSLAQALVVGNQLFVTTDSTDVNAAAYGTGGATGRVLTYDLVAATTSTTTVQGGASSLAAAATGELYNASSDKQEQLAAAATFGGTSVDGFVLPKVTRRLWLSSL